MARRTKQTAPFQSSSTKPQAEGTMCYCVEFGICLYSCLLIWYMLSLPLLQFLMLWKWWPYSWINIVELWMRFKCTSPVVSSHQFKIRGFSSCFLNLVFSHLPVSPRYDSAERGKFLNWEHSCVLHCRIRAWVYSYPTEVFSPLPITDWREDSWIWGAIGVCSRTFNAGTFLCKYGLDS